MMRGSSVEHSNGTPPSKMRGKRPNGITGLLAICLLMLMMVLVVVQYLGNGTRGEPVTNELPSSIVWRHYGTNSAVKRQEDAILGQSPALAKLVFSPDGSASIEYLGCKFTGTVAKSYTKEDRACYTVVPLVDYEHWRVTLWTPIHWEPGHPQGEWLISVVLNDGSSSYTDGVRFYGDGTAVFVNGAYNAEAEEAKQRDARADSQSKDDEDEEEVDINEYDCQWHSVPTDDGLFIVLTRDGGEIVAFISE